MSPELNKIVLMRALSQISVEDGRERKNEKFSHERAENNRRES